MEKSTFYQPSIFFTKIFPQLQFYKCFYDEYNDLIELYKKDFQSEPKLCPSNRNYEQLLDFDPTSLSKMQSGIYRQCFSQIRLSKLEQKQLELATVQSLNYQSAKFFLLKLSEQLYLNSNFQQFCSNSALFFTGRKQNQKRLKLMHSNSNFLDAYSNDQEFAQIISEDNAIQFNTQQQNQEIQLPVMTKIMKNNYYMDQAIQEESIELLENDNQNVFEFS